MKKEKIKKPVEERMEKYAKSLEDLLYFLFAISEIALTIYAFTQNIAFGIAMCTVGLFIFIIPYVVNYLIFRMIELFCKMSKNLDIIANRSDNQK